MQSTIFELLEAQAKAQGDFVAILAPGRKPLCYRDLLSQIESTRDKLREIGIGHSERIALILQNGPEMAASFLSIAAAASCAPLNPSYQAQELDFYLNDLGADAIVVAAEDNSIVRQVAELRNIPIIELISSMDESAGNFSLSDKIVSSASKNKAVQPDDVALLLHTSGTTSRPKLVPLTHQSLCASAAHIRTSLTLTHEDRCLNVMPLFHIHGLVGALLASLSGGASIVCSPGFYAPRFFEWMETYRPTWYTAVPTMHQAILSRLEKNLDVVANCPLRFIRSCSAALPENIMHKLEQKIQVPVIESYGMTEAAHQMASNPMPPARRKPGSVGVAAGPEIAIMNEQGDLMPQGEVGEVVIRGPNVTGGYENNSEANQQSFTKGWFRTGDQGWLDEEGYLFLKGRLKEIINRGGEKISPREIDEVLMTHEAVGQAVAFAVPHEKLGEELAAAVTLKAGASLIESELQQFVASKLVDFKIPRQILFLKDIPKGPTGKLQRIGLAQRLGLTQQIKEKKSEKPGYQPPRTLSEKTLAKIWIDVLGIKRVGIYDEFLDLGGDSILAVLLFTEVEKRFGRKLLMSTLFQASTVAQQANLLDKNEMDLSFRSLVTLRARGSEFPLFLVHPLTGGVAGFYSLVRHMQSEGPICAFQAQGIDGTLPPLGSVEAMAQRYLVELCEVQPHGPYFLAGHSFGGMICFEMARQLSLKGEKIAFLGLLDAQATDYPKSEPRDLNESLHRKFEIVNYHLSHLMELEWQGKWRYIWRRVRNRLSRLQDPPHMELILSAHAKAKRDYKPKNYKDRAVLFRSSIEVPGLKAPRDWGWSDWILGGLKIFDVRGCHLTSVEEYPRTLAKTLDRVLSEARNQARNLSRSDFRRS